MSRGMSLGGLMAAVSVYGLACSAQAALPTYSVEVVDTYQTTTTLTGASEAGHFVGWQVVNGLVRGFVARAGEGLTVLPLPDGYQSSTALDVNGFGVVVGAVDEGGLPFDGGEPAIWTPDGAGGYTVAIPEQFASLPSPIGGTSGSGSVQWCGLTSTHGSPSSSAANPPTVVNVSMTTTSGRQGLRRSTSGGAISPARRHRR